MKMPDEIKKALKCHRDGRACHDCPYEQVRTFSVDGVTFGCSKDIVADALDYIERLEAKMEERAMSETPKCPGCGRKMVFREDFHKFFFVCLDCGWKSPYGQNEKEGLDLALKRAEPKNRVLTLEELKVYTGFLWSENRYSPFDYEGEPTFVEEGFMYDGIDLRRDISNVYGKNWRCWLKKPTAAERRGTSWEGDSRE